MDTNITDDKNENDEVVSHENDVNPNVESSEIKNDKNNQESTIEVEKLNNIEENKAINTMNENKSTVPVEANNENNQKVDINNIITEKAEIELNSHYLDKLFDATQQQKSIKKPNDNENKKDDETNKEEAIEPNEIQPNQDENKQSVTPHVQESILNDHLIDNTNPSNNPSPDDNKNADQKPLIKDENLNDKNNDEEPQEKDVNSTDNRPIQVSFNFNPLTQDQAGMNSKDANDQVGNVNIPILLEGTNLPIGMNSNVANYPNDAKIADNNLSSSSYYDDEEEEEAGNLNLPPSSDIFHKNSILNPIFIQQQKEVDDGIPPALKPLIYHAKDSLTYQALCGKQIHGLRQSALTSIVNDLRKYVDIAVDHNLINEACHVQMCIDTIRNDHSHEKMEADKEITEIDKKIQEANVELEERLNFWKNQEETIKKEYEMQLIDLNISKDQALSDLDNEWQTPKKQQLYSKPSPALLNMRHMAKKMIRTQQFEEVQKLARLIEDKEKQEIEEASRRMNEDYHIADQRLNEHYDNEQKIIESTHQMKIHNLIRTREQNLRPLHQRIENLLKMKDQATKVQKKAAQLVMATTPRKRNTASSTNISNANTPRYLSGKTTSRVSKNANVNPQKQLPQLLVTPKLALPPVQRIKRDGARSQIGQPSVKQNQQLQQQQQPSLYRPKALSRLSNSSVEKNSSRKNVNSPKYH